MNLIHKLSTYDPSVREYCPKCYWPGIVSSSPQYSMTLWSTKNISAI
jgi:hypothetical protein